MHANKLMYCTRLTFGNERVHKPHGETEHDEGPQMVNLHTHTHTHTHTDRDHVVDTNRSLMHPPLLIFLDAHSRQEISDHRLGNTLEGPTTTLGALWLLVLAQKRTYQLLKGLFHGQPLPTAALVEGDLLTASRKGQADRVTHTVPRDTDHIEEAHIIERSRHTHAEGMVYLLVMTLELTKRSCPSRCCSLTVMGPTGDLSLEGGGTQHKTQSKHTQGWWGIQYLVKISPDTARYSNIVMGPYRDFMSFCDKAHITTHRTTHLRSNAPSQSVYIETNVQNRLQRR